MPLPQKKPTKNSDGTRKVSSFTSLYVTNSILKSNEKGFQNKFDFNPTTKEKAEKMDIIENSNKIEMRRRKNSFGGVRFYFTLKIQKVV